MTDKEKIETAVKKIRSQVEYLLDVPVSVEEKNYEHIDGVNYVLGIGGLANDAYCLVYNELLSEIKFIDCVKHSTHAAQWLKNHMIMKD